MECCSIFSDEELLREVGVTNAEGPPVPIPNTEVKLCSVDNTCLATDREDRSMPTSVSKNEYSSLAQSVERMTVNHDVAGSSPAGGAKTKTTQAGGFLFWLPFFDLKPASISRNRKLQRSWN